MYVPRNSPAVCLSLLIWLHVLFLRSQGQNRCVLTPQEGLDTSRALEAVSAVLGSCGITELAIAGVHLVSQRYPRPC